jgi:hypothetical protein
MRLGILFIWPKQWVGKPYQPGKSIAPAPDAMIGQSSVQSVKGRQTSRNLLKDQLEFKS